MSNDPSDDLPSPSGHSSELEAFGDEDVLGQLIDLPGLSPHASQQLARAILGPTPRVVMPSGDAMAVRLVPISALHQYDDLRSDQALVVSATFLLIGAVLGLLTSMVMSTSSISAAAWTLGACLTVATAVATALSVRCARRLRPARARLYSEVDE